MIIKTSPLLLVSSLLLSMWPIWCTCKQNMQGTLQYGWVQILWLPSQLLMPTHQVLFRSICYYLCRTNGRTEKLSRLGNILVPENVISTPTERLLKVVNFTLGDNENITASFPRKDRLAFLLQYVMLLYKSQHSYF